MPAAKLPGIKTAGAPDFCQRWDQSSKKGKEQLAKTFGVTYGVASNFRNRCKKKGVDKPREVDIKPAAPYPPLELMPFVKSEHGRDEEDFVIFLTDLHIGKITPSYSLAILQQRLDSILSSAMKIINLHAPIRKAHIFGLGDIVQGENPHQGSKIGEVSIGAEEQVNDYAVPALSRFCCSLAQGVQEVNFYGVTGNHGIYEKTAPSRTNWDRFVYRNLESVLANHKSVHIYPPGTFYQLVNIRGFRFFAIHGNQVNAVAGIPLFAMRRKMQEWHAYVGGFNYAYAGHFHTHAADQVNSVADYTICPPLVTGDSWAVEMVGRAANPQVLCCGVHAKYGRTWQYLLFSDESFLPRHFAEAEGVVRPGG